MDQRNIAAYVGVINHFKERTAPTLLPAIIMTGFEAAMQTAFRTAYPNAEVKGCFFHFSQVRTKIVMFGIHYLFLTIIISEYLENNATTGTSKCDTK